MPFSYEKWIRQAKDRLELLYRQREQISAEISGLEKGIEGFKPLVKSLWASPDAGLTESIRVVFRSNPARLFSPVSIRQELMARGFTLQQQNPMAAIHQTLARLSRRQEVKLHLLDGQTRYQHAEPPATPGERETQKSGTAPRKPDLE